MVTVFSQILCTGDRMMRQKLGPCHCEDSDQEVTANIKYVLLKGSLEGTPKALQSHAVRGYFRQQWTECKTVVPRDYIA